MNVVPRCSDCHTQTGRLSQIQMTMVTHVKEIDQVTKIVSVMDFGHSSLFCGTSQVDEGARLLVYCSL